MLSSKRFPCSTIIVNLYHLRYRAGRPYHEFLGVEMQQYPQDLLIYQELAWKLKPPFVIETGVKSGGSVLYWAHLLDSIGAAASVPIIGVDWQMSEQARALKHPRIKLVEGSSVDPQTIEKVRALLPQPSGGVVILDSDHSAKHVLEELRVYREFVGVGSYLVAGDSSYGHPIPGHGAGPCEAATQFLREDDRFVRDNEIWKKYNLISAHQYGWLRRVK